EPLSAVQIDNQMGAGALHAVAHTEVVFAILRRHSWHESGRFLPGGTCHQALPRSQEGNLSHSVLHNQRSKPSASEPARTAKCRRISSARGNDPSGISSNNTTSPTRKEILRRGG